MSGDLQLQPPLDGISSLAWSSDSTSLLVASWDSTIQLHNVSSAPTAPQMYVEILGSDASALTISLTHPSAVLAVTFGSDSATAFSGGLDKRVRQWDLTSGQCKVLGTHDNAVSSLAWCPEHNVLISGSWDKTIKVWNPSNPDQPLKSTHHLPERVYNLSYAPTTARLLVSMAHRHVSVYSLPTLAAATDGQDTKAEQNRESALKFLTRSVAVMADGKGWASGSVEGRISVEYFETDADTQSQKYAFRAHRQTVEGVDQVYPINALAYHPIHNTFASGGSDGFISIWDHSAKKRMKLYPKFPTSISALAFSPDGSRLAIGASYEHDNAVGGEDKGKVLVLIKDTVMDDCRPKAKA